MQLWLGNGVVAGVGLHFASPPMPTSDVRVRFQEFLAQRRPLPAHHGLLVDTRTMPFAQGVEGSTGPVQLEVFLTSLRPPLGRATWRYALAMGQSLEIELTMLGDESPRLPEPVMASKMLDYNTGAQGLGDFAIENRDGHGHNIGWLRGNVKVAVRRSYLPKGGSVFLGMERALEKNARTKPLAQDVAARVDAWLATLPIVDLDAHRVRLDPVLTPSDAVVGEQVRLTWKQPLQDPSRFEMHVDGTWQHFGREEHHPQESRFEASSEGPATLDVLLVDRVTLLVSHARFTYDVVDFNRQLGRMDPAQLIPFLQRERPERSWRIIERLLAAPPTNQTAATIASTYSWWNDSSRPQTIAEQAWPHPSTRRELLQDRKFQTDLPRWIAMFASQMAIPKDPPDVDGFERHRQITRSVVTELMGLQQASAVIRLASVLEPAIVRGTWKSFASAFHELRDHRGALATTVRISAGITAPRPEYVLWQSNLAAEQLLAGDGEIAERILDAVLTRDWNIPAANRVEPMSSLLARAKAGDREAGSSYELRTYLAMAYYNRACVHARHGDARRAAADLGEARRNNPDAYSSDKIAAESDFDSVRSSPDFAPFAH
jgi:hypothetical protein